MTHVFLETVVSVPHLWYPDLKCSQFQPGYLYRFFSNEAHIIFIYKYGMVISNSKTKGKDPTGAHINIFWHPYSLDLEESP